MAGTDPLDLMAVAEELLTVCEDALDTVPAADPSLAGRPDRAFVSPGQPALDCCDQLAVWVSAVTEAQTAPGGLAASRRYVTGRINHVGLVATITRCVPTFDQQGNPPSTTDLNAAAAQLNADAWALWNHVWNEERSGRLFSLCGEAFWDGIRPVNPSGGCAGWNLILRVSLDGYQEP